MFKNSNISLLLQHFRSVVGVFICLLIIRKLSIFIPMKQLNLIKNIKYHTIHRNMEKWKFWFLNVLIHRKLFHRNLLLNALYAYLFSFLFPWSSMRKFPCAVWKVGTFPHMDKEETFFFLENCTLVWSKFFYIIIFSWDHKIF